MQVVNSQIALGSGGLFGKGLVSEGSSASLGYIPDDHTDMIFAIVCEAFGFVGGGSLILAYLLLIFRLVQHAIRVQDAFGSYIIFGVTAMLLFHIVENICMVIGLLPVTGIPLPFVSYGGSSLPYQHPGHRPGAKCGDARKAQSRAQRAAARGADLAPRRQCAGKIGQSSPPSDTIWADKEGIVRTGSPDCSAPSTTSRRTLRSRSIMPRSRRRAMHRATIFSACSASCADTRLGSTFATAGCRLPARNWPPAARR